MHSQPLAKCLLGCLLLCSFGTTAALAQTGSNSYTVDEAWAQLPDGAGWDGATSWVAADGEGSIVVMVRSAPYFREFTRDGSFVRAWGEEPEFRNAHSVTFDDDGFLWATDAANHVVYKFNPDGELIQILGSPGQAGDNNSATLFNQPNHVTIAANGDIYVSGGYVNARIVQFSADGDFIRVIGGDEGDAPGQLKVPHGVALDSQGRILINDSGNQRISVFGSDGEFIDTWPYPSRGGIVVTADDTVYASDVNAGAINVIRDGELVDSIHVDARPHGLAVDDDGAVYVSDSLGRKVMKITRD